MPISLLKIAQAVQKTSGEGQATPEGTFVSGGIAPQVPTNFYSILTEQAKKFNYNPMEVASGISEASKKYGFPINFLYQTINRESTFDPSARSKEGAIGIGQFTPITIKEIKERYNPNFNPYNIKQSIDAMGWLLKDYSRQTGVTNLEDLYWVYNYGPEGYTTRFGKLKPKELTEGKISLDLIAQAAQARPYTEEELRHRLPGETWPEFLERKPQLRPGGIREAMGKTAKDEMARLDAVINIKKREIEEKGLGMPLLGPGFLGKGKELGIKSQEQFDKMAEITNLERAVQKYKDFIGELEGEPGVEKIVRDITAAYRDATADTTKLIPYLGGLLQLTEATEALIAANKLKKGEEISDYESSLIEKYRAESLPIPRGLPYNVTKMIMEMPTYIAEFGLSKAVIAKPVVAAIRKAIGEGISVTVPKVIQSVWKVPARASINSIIASGVGVISQATVHSLVKLPTEIALRAIPYNEQLENPIVQEFYTKIGGEFAWEKAMIQAFGINTVEILTEYAGGLIEEPAKWLSQATLGKWMQKAGIKVTSELFEKGAKAVNWNGIIGEVFEEELAELIQAPIEEREYLAPWTPQGAERLLTETLGIMAFGGISKLGAGTLEGGIQLPPIGLTIKEVSEKRKKPIEIGVVQSTPTGKLLKDEGGVFFSKEPTPEFGEKTIEAIFRGRNTFESTSQYEAVEQIFGKDSKEAKLFDKLIEKEISGAIDQREAFKQIDKIIADKIRSQGYDSIHYTNSPFFGEEFVALKESAYEIGKPTEAIPKELEPLAKEARKYKSIEELLPKGINIADIKSTEVFGSSIAGKTFRDIDVALFVDKSHPILKKAKVDALLGEFKVGNIEYSVFADTEYNKRIFVEFAREGKLGPKKGAITRKIDIADFYTQAVKRAEEVKPEEMIPKRKLTKEEAREQKKKDDQRLIRRTVKKAGTEEWPEEVKQLVDKEVKQENIASHVASRFNVDDLKEFRFLAGIFKRTKRLQEGDIDTFLRDPKYGKRLNATLEEISSQMEDPEQPSLYAMSQEDLFDEMIKLSKYTPKELTDLGKISKSMEATALSDEWIQRISFFDNPPAKRVSIAFALLGNKKTTVPLFREIFTDWVKTGGITTIIEPWGGAFTLPTHSIPEAIEAGLKEFHTNVFDKEKLLIVNAIKEGKVDEVKTSLDKAVKKLHKQMLVESRAEPIVEKAFNEFIKEFPESYIGSHDWARFARRGQLNSLNSRVRTLKDYYKSFAWVFQNAINSLWGREIKTLDDAIMFSVLKRINRYAGQSQDLITDSAGFKTKQDSIYGKFGMSQGFDDIDRLFKLAEEKGTNIIIHSEDSEQLVKKFKDFDPKTTGWFLDPPYVNEAKRVYGKEKGLAGVAPLEKFTSGEKLYEAHKEIFESINKGARGAWTNDLDEKYLDAMNEHLEGSQFMAYRELRTPTSLVVDKETKDIVQRFLAQPPKVAKIADEEYLQRRLNTVSGYTNKVINSLIERGFKQEKIDQLRIEGRYLKNLVKVKREKTGRVSAVISKEALDYIKRNYNDKFVSDEWIKTTSPKAIGIEVLGVMQGLENGQRFFRRLSKEYVDESGHVRTEGLKNIVFDSIRQGERKAVEMEQGLKRIELKSVRKLKKKQAKQLWAYTMIRQGKIEPDPELTFNKLHPKVQRAYMDIRMVAEKYYPQVKEAGELRGLEVGHIKNYTPLYTRGDLRQIDEGGMNWTRKDPYFGSVKERVEEEVPIELYEQDYRKVMDHWITGLSKYIEVGKRTVPVKYLIDSDEFKEIVGGKMHQRIYEWYKYLVSPPRVEGIWRGVRILRKLQATAILGIRDTVVLKQFLNWFDFRAAINSRRLVKGGIKVMRRSQMARIAKASGSIMERSAGLAIQDLKGITIRWLQAPTVWADRLTAKMGMVGIMDQMIDRLYKEGKELTPDEFKRIHRMASNVVDAVMGGMSRAETPKYFRTEGGKNLFMFFSQLNSKMQYYVSDIFSHRWKFLNELSGTHRRLFARAIVTLIIGAYLESVISRLSFGDDPEDIAKITLKTLVGNFPILGNIWYALETGESYDVSPILGNVTELIKNIHANKTEDAIWTGTAFFGMPQQIKRYFQGIKVVQAGGLRDKQGRFMFRVTTDADIIRTILRGKWMSKSARQYFKKKEGGAPAGSTWYKRGGGTSPGASGWYK